MPSKNEIKAYSENSFYHIYNRGVEKRKIFVEVIDFSVFISYLNDYLSLKDTKTIQNQVRNPNTNYKNKAKLLKLLRLNNFSDNLSLHAYALMPNHFHLLVKQKSARTINKFMNSLITRYSMYFNRKYKRVGPLFQGVYKAVLVKSEEQLLHLSKYIHSQTIFNPKHQITKQPFPSSYPNYLKKFQQDWINTEFILGFFNKSKNVDGSYKSFVENYNNENLKLIGDLILD